MNEKIDIWLVGNTGLRNPNRIQDGFKVFAGSPFVGNLHGKENEIGFMNFLNEKGIIQNEDGCQNTLRHAGPCVGGHYPGHLSYAICKEYNSLWPSRNGKDLPDGQLCCGDHRGKIAGRSPDRKP